MALGTVVSLIASKLTRHDGRRQVETNGLDWLIVWLIVWLLSSERSQARYSEFVLGVCLQTVSNFFEGVCI